MQLIIRHSTTQENSDFFYFASYALREHMNMPALIERRLANTSLLELAARWYLVYGDPDKTDVNAKLLLESTRTMPVAEANPPLSLLATNTFNFKHADPMIVAAMDERVRRVCAMISEDALWEGFLSSTQEQNLPIGSDKAQPYGRALPPIDPEQRKKILNLK